MIQLQLTREQASILSLSITQRCMKIDEMLNLFDTIEMSSEKYREVMETSAMHYREEFAILQEIRNNLYKFA